MGIPEDSHVIISTNRGEPLVMKKRLTLSGLAFENTARRLVGKQDYLIDLETPYKRIFYVLSTSDILEQNKDFNILIALSAGQDSTCLSLFIIIYQKLIYPNKKIRVGIVHCQHNWDTFSLDKANHIDSWLILLKELGVEVTLYSSIP